MASNRGIHFGTPRGGDRKTARRTGGIALAIVVLLVLGVGVGAAVGLSGVLSPHERDAGKQTATQNSDAQGSDGRGEVTDETASDEPADSTGDQQGQSAEQQLPEGDDRAAELACDPNAQTDWLDHSNGEKTLYLTFDDGPSANTEKILDILDKYGAKATFFVTGHEPEYRPMIAEAYRRGNTIGMHSFTHDYATIYQSEDAFFDDLSQVADVVKEQIGYVPYLIRFPGGVSNTVSESYCPGIMTALDADVQARGYQYYDWNVSSNDAAGNTVPTDQIVQASCSYGSYTNVILLCHDSGTKTTTVEALPQIIEYYQSQGFTCKPIDRSTVVVHHHINN